MGCSIALLGSVNETLTAASYTPCPELDVIYQPVENINDLSGYNFVYVMPKVLRGKSTECAFTLESKDCFLLI